MIQQHFDKKFSANGPQNYENYFVPVIGKPLALDLVELANLHPGEKVLDVACGTGIVSRLACEKVGSEGSVEGIDVNPGMLAFARSITNVKNMEWYEANAEAMPLTDDSYDVVLCQMGLQFMEDKAVALKEMKRVMKDGGRLLFNLPGPAAEPFTDMANAMNNNISAKAAGFINQVFSLHDRKEIHQLMQEAGFEKFEIKAGKKTLSLPPAADFLWQYVYSTPLAAVLSEAAEQSLRNLEEELTKRWQKFGNNGQIVYEQPMVTVIAGK